MSCAAFPPNALLSVRPRLATQGRLSTRLGRFPDRRARSGSGATSVAARQFLLVITSSHEGMRHLVQSEFCCWCRFCHNGTTVTCLGPRRRGQGPKPACRGAVAQPLRAMPRPQASSTGRAGTRLLAARSIAIIGGGLCNCEHTAFSLKVRSTRQRARCRSNSKHDITPGLRLAHNAGELTVGAPHFIDNARTRRRHSTVAVIGLPALPPARNCR
jgi:hypothetical protein